MKVLSATMLSCALFGISFRPINLPTEENFTSQNFDACSYKNLFDRSKMIKSWRWFNSSFCNSLSILAQRKQNKHDDYVEQSENTHSKKNATNILNKFMSAMSLDLFNNPVYVLFCVSSFLTCLGYYVPYICIADKALTLDIPKENASHVLSTIGITNTLGRLILGYIADKRFVNRLWVYNICLIICGTGEKKCIFLLIVSHNSLYNRFIFS